MSSNTFGKLFRLTTYGESHGVAMGAIVDGCPPGLALTEEVIQPALDRRRPGQSHYTSQRQEADRIQILSGVFEGSTTGAPIGLQIQNHDAKANDYEDHRNIYRPGHADFTYQHKYGIRDHRGGGRASARETAMWVAAGAIAYHYLQLHFDIKIYAYLAQMGDLVLEPLALDEIENNLFFCPDPNKISKLEQKIADIRKQKDSLGAIVKVVVMNVPIGLGAPVFNKLDADIAHAMMSINAAKGVEIGAGFASALQMGSQHRDPITPLGFVSNNGGGVLGGISTGQRLEVAVAFKPTSSIPQAIATVNHANEAVTTTVTGRHDPCVGIRAVPVVEAMMALVLMDHVMLHSAQCGSPSKAK